MWPIVLLLFVASIAGCDGGAVPSPFGDSPDSGLDAERAGAEGGSEAPEPADAQVERCTEDGDCDDGVACTFDACDETLSQCRHSPDHFACDDGVFCNGVEECHSSLGCRAGAPETCSDNSACTIDRCNETQRTCEHAPRDADGDGDPDFNCAGGGDCDERDPRVSSLAHEICRNSKDDDCDGDIDEGEDCVTQRHDTCADALEIHGSGTYELDVRAARSDVSVACYEGGAGGRELVVALIVPEGPALDIDVVAASEEGMLGLASASECADASTETACARGTRTPAGDALSRLVLRALEPGAHVLYVLTDSDAAVTLSVRFGPETPIAENETCTTARPVELGHSVSGSLAGTRADIPTRCPSLVGDLVYRFDLTESRDVRLYATTLDGFGAVTLSLRDESCSALSNELICRSAANNELYRRALGPGRYFVSVGGSGPTDFDLRLVATPPTSPPEDETCAGAAELRENVTVEVDLSDHTDDLRMPCGGGGVDAAYELELGERSDVLLVERLSSGDETAVALANDDCSKERVCRFGSESPVRAASHDVPAGTYRAVVESALGSPISLTAFVRPASAPTLVAFADTCDDAVPIPPRGGFFQGTTSNAQGDYDAGCDLGGQQGGAAADQMLRLELDEPRRVVFDMQGSAYSTLLDVRRGPACPGVEVAMGCSVGRAAARSFLDLQLEAGDYFVQVDGYGGAEGQWFLDVFVTEP